MKVIVLEHPRISSEKKFNEIANTPLCSCLMGGYAAAVLEKSGMDVTFIDDALPGITFGQSAKNILALQADLLCVNGVYFWEHTDRLFEFLATLKRDGFAGHINLFGFLPSLVYADILEGTAVVDSIAVGEFEHTLIALAAALVRDDLLADIPGLATRSEKGDITYTARLSEKLPDLFAFPRRISLDSTVTVQASRGCYNRCNFCLVPAFDADGARWRGRSPQNIFSEMEGLVAHGVRDFYFADPNFVGPGRVGKERTLALLDLIKPLNITFGMETRPNDLDDEIMENLVGAGMTSLLMGIESGSADILRLIKKSSSADTAIEAIKLCRKHGIEPEVGFLMFVPDAHLRDIRSNLTFLQKNNLLDRLDRTANLLCHRQIVLAGTSGYTFYEKQGRLVKSGVFGFEGEVRFKDPKVGWVAELVIFACLSMLQNMSDPHSPIFWQRSSVLVSQTANKYLVGLFQALLVDAEGNGTLQDISSKKEEIHSQISKILITS